MLNFCKLQLGYLRYFYYRSWLSNFKLKVYRKYQRLHFKITKKGFRSQILLIEIEPPNLSKQLNDLFLNFDKVVLFNVKRKKFVDCGDLLQFDPNSKQ